MDVIGWIGLIMLLSARIPDTIKSIRSRKAPDISVTFMVIYFVASVLLTVHARIIKDRVFIILNAVASGLSGTNLILKALFGRRRG